MNKRIVAVYFELESDSQIELLRRILWCMKAPDGVSIPFLFDKPIDGDIESVRAELKL